MANFITDAFGNAVGDSLLILGDISFSYTEVAETFNFGGQQLLHTHQLVGGARTIDALGRSDDDIGWTGLFWGTDASERARALNFLKNEGQQIELIFGEFWYLVVIADFKPVFERYYQVPYTITLRVVQDLTVPVPVPVPNNYNSAVDSDYNSITGDLIAANSPALTAAVASLGASISNAGNLATATPAQLAAIQQNIADCQVINEGFLALQGATA